MTSSVMKACRPIADYFSITPTHSAQQQRQLHRRLLLDALIVATIAVAADELQADHVAP